MGGLDAESARLPAEAMSDREACKAKREVEHIRRVFDEEMAGKKFASIISPREDASMFRSTDRHAVPCECIVEIYELLWRWGHRNTEKTGFAPNFGFTIPDTIVISKGKPYAWYFISKKDGSLLRKTEGSLSVGAIEKKLCRERGDGECPVCAIWLPMTTQFPEARCHSQCAEFLSTSGCRDFLANMRMTHSGIIQAFVEPHGVSNFLARTVHYSGQTSLCVRTNRSLLNGGRGNFFMRCATFEGWEGLSSSCSRYRSHRHPQMEDLILEVGDCLNQRIELERVRQMLFLEPTQHVALHFKVTKDHCLYFIFASVITEKEVILQTRPQLLMRDCCMTEALPCAALLPGGTARKAPQNEAPECARRKPRKREPLEDGSREEEGEERRPGSLPPIWHQRSGDSGGVSGSRRPLTARRNWKDETLLPRMAYARPEVPLAPYQSNSVPHNMQEAGRYEYHPPFLGLEVVKRPLISTTASARSEPPRTAR